VIIPDTTLLSTQPVRGVRMVCGSVGCVRLFDEDEAGTGA